jgi:hypothetical protein
VVDKDERQPVVHPAVPHGPERTTGVDRFVTKRQGRLAQGAVFPYSWGVADRDCPSSFLVMTERISLGDLQNRILDLNVSDEELQHYLVISGDATTPFAPAVVPNVESVILQGPLDSADVQASSFLDVFQDLVEQRRLLKFKESRRTYPQRPILFAEGDSWFQFPIFLKDLIDHLSKDYSLYCISRAGDTIENMVYGNPDYLDVLADLLADQGAAVQGFLFSGAGNDVIGKGDGDRPVLEEILRPYNASELPHWHVMTPRADQIFQYIADAYRRIFSEIDARFPAATYPSLRVYLHGYDYVQVRGLGPAGDPNKPVWAAEWTSGPLRARGFTNNAFGSRVIAALIDRLNDTTAAVCAEHPRGVYVNLRGSVGDRNWVDELHPTSKGYGQAAERFRTYLV